MADSAAPNQIWHGRLAYDGTRFHGWQIQPQVRTVQGELTRRLRLLFNCDHLRVSGTSRTDAGVHALEQHFSFADPAPGRFSEERLTFQLRRWLPDDILLRDLVLERDDFHARHSAEGKAYTYTVCRQEAPSPFEAAYVWACTHAIDLASIRAAASCLTGTHDFTALSAAGKQEVETPVKTIHRLDVMARGEHLYFNVVGTSFLYKMVRSIVGYLLLNVGRDRDWSPDKTGALLESKCRGADVQTAPPQGLFLAKVFFDANAWREYRPVLPPQAGEETLKR